MSSKLLIIGIIILGGTTLVWLFFFQSDVPTESGIDNTGENDVAEESMQEVPQLSFRDYNDNTIALADFKGTPLVVNSWAKWCPFCVKELPDFAAVLEDDDEVVFVGVNRQESLSVAKEFTDSLALNDDFIFVLDPDDSFFRSLKSPFAMPQTLFVDREGIVQFHKLGVMSAEEFAERLDLIR